MTPEQAWSELDRKAREHITLQAGRRREAMEQRAAEVIFQTVPACGRPWKDRWGARAAKRLRQNYEVPEQDADLWRCGKRLELLDWDENNAKKGGREYLWVARVLSDRFGDRWFTVKDAMLSANRSYSATLRTLLDFAGCSWYSREYYQTAIRPFAVRHRREGQRHLFQVMRAT